MYVVSELLNRKFDSEEECRAAEEKFKALREEEIKYEEKLKEIQARREEVRKELFGEEEKEEKEEEPKAVEITLDELFDFLTSRFKWY